MAMVVSSRGTNSRDVVSIPWTLTGIQSGRDGWCGVSDVASAISAVQGTTIDPYRAALQDGCVDRATKPRLFHLGVCSAMGAVPSRDGTILRVARKEAQDSLHHLQRERALS